MGFEKKCIEKFGFWKKKKKTFKKNGSLPFCVGRSKMRFEVLLLLFLNNAVKKIQVFFVMGSGKLKNNLIETQLVEYF